MRLILPRNQNDSSGLLYEYRNIEWHADASSYTDNERLPDYAFSPENSNDWSSNETDFSPWVRIVFPKHYLSISHYSIKSPAYTTEVYFPRCWDVFGKINNQWIKISSVNDSGLTERGITRVFPIYNNQRFNGFQFNMTCDNYGEESRYKYSFMVNHIDFFGSFCAQSFFKTISPMKHFALFCIFIK